MKKPGKCLQPTQEALQRNFCRRKQKTKKSKRNYSSRNVKLSLGMKWQVRTFKAKCTLNIRVKSKAKTSLKSMDGHS